MTKLDPRLHAYRPDVADLRLRSRVEASRYVVGQRLQVVDPIISVHKLPRPDAIQLTQALLGETVLRFDEQGGWAFVQLEADGYVGYVSSSALSDAMVEPTHIVAVPSTPRYTVPNLKSQPVTFIPMNAVVEVTAQEGNFSRLSDGYYVWSRHLRPKHRHADDYVAVAEQFTNTPYYWGGKSVWGVDCSGLVQLALQACGVAVGRDSDMQEQTLGDTLPIADLERLRRGDLVFWRGHVGIMTDGRTLLHANGHHMLVAAEPLLDAVKRIASSYGQVTSIKRL
jgi:cell wall-associated NlpC family hydrolase